MSWVAAQSTRLEGSRTRRITAIGELYFSRFCVKNVPNLYLSLTLFRSSQPSSFSKNVLAPKQKVMSILEKARTAMDETYGYVT